jgi:AAA15 family ATPase/GTPase
MILEFSVENFLSIKNLSTLSMIGAKSFKEHENTNSIQIDTNLKVLKSAVIYGSNASGKSNFLNAIGFMKSVVLNSFKDAISEESSRKIALNKFLLSSETDNKPSYFEVVFSCEDKKFRYGFEISEEIIESEWLYYTDSRETPLFTREGQKFDINKSSFSEGLGLEKRTRENVLFLSLVAQLNGEVASKIIKWFKNLNLISGIHDRSYKRYTIDRLKSDNNFLKWLSDFINFLEITKLSTEEEEVEDIDLETLKKKEKDEEIINLFSSLQKIQSKQPRRDRIITWHRKFDENNLLIDSIPFSFDSDESEGTKKLIYLLGPWYDSLKNGKILVVDELDSRLHSKLTLKLVEYFHRHNTNNAQLIFAVHDTSILNKEVFRRDQIWFIDKDQFGVSNLYSLADFSSEQVRNKSAFDKNYLEGKYGAIPLINEPILN